MTKHRKLGKTYIKNILREIKGSIGRCFAIVAIALLTTSVVTGLLLITPYLKNTMDVYLDGQNTMDIFIKSELGLTEDDLLAIRRQEIIGEAEAAKSLDKLILNSSGKTLTARFYGQSFENQINRLMLREGRLPENTNECLAIAGRDTFYPVAVGEKLKISPANDDFENIGDEFAETEFTVVGIAESPLYYAKLQEMSTLGSGSVDTVLYTLPESFNLEVYTDFFLKLKGSEEFVAFTDEYNDFVSDAIDALEVFGKERADIRIETVRAEAEAELADAWDEYRSERADAEAELADAKKKLDEAKIEIEDAEKQLDEGEAEIEKGYAELQKGKNRFNREMKAAEKQFADAELQIEAAKAELAQGKEQLLAQENRVNTLRRIAALIEELPPEYQDDFAVLGSDSIGNIANVIGEVLQSDRTAEEKMQIIGTITKIGVQLLSLGGGNLGGEMESVNIYDAITAYDAAMQEIEAAESLIAEQEKQLEEGKIALEEGKKEAQREFRIAERKLKAAEEDLAKGKEEFLEGKGEYLSGRMEYYEGLAEAEEGFAEAEEKLAEAEEDIWKLEEKEWYILDKQSTMSYASFMTNIVKVDVIVRLFPVFFMLVALLVSLTTMTRMVEEQRIQIGTLKALGFSKAAILGKYVIYSGAASVLGSIIGAPVGIWILPKLIYNAFLSLYDMPPLIIGSHSYIGIIVTLACIGCTVGSAAYSCLSSLREKPASLMLPKAPKAGKRIFLEYIRPLWRKLSFSKKATARNILRNKKNLFMTVLGVAGCTALLIIGFGLKSAMEISAQRQYDAVLRYDLIIRTEEDTSYLRELAEIGREHYTRVRFENAEMMHDNKSFAIELYIPENTEEFGKFFGLHDMHTLKELPLDDDSVILSYALAKEIGAEKGSEISIKNTDADLGRLIVTDIAENYFGAFAVVGKNAAADAYGTLKANAWLAESGINTAEEKDAFLLTLLENEDVKAASFSSDAQGTFDILLSSMTFIVLFIIAASGALVATVLYNLTNININERKRELAALRVLGYHKKEVGRYIFREIVILCVLGTLVGLVLGHYFHLFVLDALESFNMCFGVSLDWPCYLYAAVITMAFSGLVDIFMYKTKVKTIDMAESMKAVD